jgi:L-threonylcarbamoyladenylate synthase
MTRIYDCAVDADLMAGMRLARASLAKGELVVVPTDTVYGVAADAFTPAAVERLDALARNVPEKIREVAATFWPGGLTIILDAQPSLAWDLGDTGGTVALRVPNNRIALELLAETGPLAVSSANLTGQPAATTASDAQAQLGESIAVYLDGGESSSTASTIIDATAFSRGTGAVRILRDGAVSGAQLRALLGDDLEPSTEQVG